MAPSILQSLLMTSMAALVSANVMKYPEVVPGPGLPSLEEVGLTSAQLYQMGMPKSRKLTNRTISQSQYLNHAKSHLHLLFLPPPPLTLDVALLILPMPMSMTLSPATTT